MPDGITALTKEMNELSILVHEIATMQRIQISTQTDHEKRIRTLEKLVFYGAGVLYTVDKVFPVLVDLFSKAK